MDMENAESNNGGDDGSLDLDLDLDLDFDIEIDGDYENWEDEVEVDDDEEDDDEEEKGNKDIDDGLIEHDQVGIGGSIDSMEDDGINPDELFKCVDYEALAARKRKAIAIGESSCALKKIKQEVSGVSQEELMEVLNFGLRRRRRKKSNESNRRGRRKGSKNKRNPEITKLLGEATILYVHDRHKEAVSKLHEVIMLGGNVPEAYHTLALVHDALGNTKIATELYTLVASLIPRDSSLWKMLFNQHMSQGNVERAIKCLSRAILDDPCDLSSRVRLALIYEEHGDHQKAAKSYEQIVRQFPDNPESREAILRAAELYLHCGQTEQSVSILEEYILSHPCDVAVISSFASILIETKSYDKALEHIERIRVSDTSPKELPAELKTKTGICYLYLGNIERAELEFSFLRKVDISGHIGLIIEVADAYLDLKQFQNALDYYYILEPVAMEFEGCIDMKIAQCSLFMGDREKAMVYLNKALARLEDTVDARLMLSSLLVEENRDDDAIVLLSTPSSDCVHSDSHKVKQWWNNGRIKLKLGQIYKAKGMLQEFIDTIFPVVRESLITETLRPKVKVKKRLTEIVLRERSKILEIGERDSIFGGVRPLASQAQLLKARRAKKLLQKKEEQKDFEFPSYCEDSEDETLTENHRDPPLLNFLKDEENFDLIIELCKALQSLEKYWEALEIIDLTRRLADKILPLAKKEELQSLAAQISYCTTDPKHSFECVKSILLQHPRSYAAWNIYYKIALRLGKTYQRHCKFLRRMRHELGEFVPPYLIAGHQFTMVSHHQDAAREYLHAFRLSSRSPLINLCVGTAFINLALGFRLQNRHLTVVQGLAFLFHNLRFSENLQEAYYNIGRACQHVGLATYAAYYYERALEIVQEDCPIPKLLNETCVAAEAPRSGHCDLRREAAFNLHLIYRSAGAFDLARQVLKNHCTF